VSLKKGEEMLSIRFTVIFMMLLCFVSFSCLGSGGAKKAENKVNIAQYADPIKGGDDKAKQEAREKLAALAKLKNAPDLEIFKELAKDNSKDVRAAVMDALARTPDGAGYFDIFVQFIESKDKDDYKSASWYTDGFGRAPETTTKTVAAWEKVFKESQSEDAKRNALTALRRCNTADAINKLKAFSIDDPNANPGILYTGIDELVFAGKISRTQLEVFMTKDNPNTKKPNHPYVRACAIYSYGKLKSKDKSIAKELLKYLDDTTVAKYNNDSAWGGGTIAGSAIRGLEATCGYDVVKVGNRNISDPKDLKSIAKDWKAYVAKMK
jgi:hypothetical protein